MHRSILALTALIALGACAAPKVVRTVPVTSGYDVKSMGWSTGHRVYLLAGTRDINGRVGVCGAVGIFGGSGPFKEMLVERFLERSAVKLNGARVFQNLNAFTVVQAEEPERLLRANCVLSDRPWVKGETYEITYNLPRYIQYGS